MGELHGGKGGVGSGCALMGAEGLGDLQALTIMGAPHGIGWGHTWLSLAGPELEAGTKLSGLARPGPGRSGRLVWGFWFSCLSCFPSIVGRRSKSSFTSGRPSSV